MTDVKTNEKQSPHSIELLLPWHAAGTLNSRDAEDVDKALAQDKELARRFAMVRKEMTETILFNETLGAPSARAIARPASGGRAVVNGAADATSGVSALRASIPCRKAQLLDTGVARTAAHAVNPAKAGCSAALRSQKG